jgi:hypothetical protein
VVLSVHPRLAAPLSRRRTAGGQAPTERRTPGRTSRPQGSRSGTGDRSLSWRCTASLVARTPAVKQARRPRDAPGPPSARGSGHVTTGARRSRQPRPSAKCTPVHGRHCREPPVSRARRGGPLPPPFAETTDARHCAEPHVGRRLFTALRLAAEPAAGTIGLGAYPRGTALPAPAPPAPTVRRRMGSILPPAATWGRACSPRRSRAMVPSAARRADPDPR